MIKRIMAAIMSATLLLAPTYACAKTHHKASVPVTTGDLQLFESEGSAQKHCPRDVVVWLNTASGIYHEKGMRWYGNTKAGAYVCKREADAAGDRDTRNGQ